MKRRVLSLIIALLGIAAGAQAETTPLVLVGSQSLSDGTYEAGDLTALTEGSITYDSSQKLLTLDNATIITEYDGIRITVSGLTVKLKGDNYINSRGAGLHLYSDVTIEGNGREYLDNLTITSKCYGISLYNSNGGRLILTISNGAKVFAEGTDYGISGTRYYSDRLAMTDKYTQLHIKGGTACINYMNLSDGPQKHGFFIYRPKGAKYQDRNETIVDADGKEVKGQWVIFQKGVSIDEGNFPDKNFRNYLLEQDYGEDGILYDEEIAAIKKINVSTKKIAKLKGIEFFTALTELYCENNQLTALDVSKNTELTYLQCYNNQLTALDVSKNTELTYLQCYNNQLTALDVSKNTELTHLYCYDNQLTALDVSKNTELTYLQCYNNQLTTLDLSNNTALKGLYCYNNQLTTLNVAGCTALTQLWCYNNQLITLDVSNTALTLIFCYNNAIRGENMTAFVNSLPTISDGNGTLSVYDDENPTGNQMDVVQVKIATDKNWQVVNRYGNDYEGEPVLTIDETNFPDENFRNWILAQDYGRDGYLTDEKIATVKAIDVSNKNITNLKGIEFYTSLEKLWCYNNQLASLDLSQNKKLTYLDCSENQLTSLDVSQNKTLKTLICNTNQLESLHVSNNTDLTSLHCYDNQLTALDVSKNMELTVLDCSRNQLTALDVSNNPKVGSIWCYTNAIRGENMDAFVSSLPDVRETGGYLVVYSDVVYEGYEERNEMTPAQVAAAKDNGWIVQKIVMTDEGPDLADFEGVRVKGDLNDDDEVNIADVVILSNAILAGSTDLMYDVNGDKKVDANDITAIVDIIIGE